MHISHSAFMSRAMKKEGLDQLRGRLAGHLVLCTCGYLLGNLLLKREYPRITQSQGHGLVFLLHKGANGHPTISERICMPDHIVVGIMWSLLMFSSASSCVWFGCLFCLVLLLVVVFHLFWFLILPVLSPKLPQIAPCNLSWCEDSSTTEKCLSPISFTEAAPGRLSETWLKHKINWDE